MANVSLEQQVSESQNAYTLASQYFKVQENLLCPPIVRAAYSDRMAWILASMSQIAYDRYENDYDARKLFITKLESGGFELIKTLTTTRPIHRHSWQKMTSSPCWRFEEQK